MTASHLDVRSGDYFHETHTPQTVDKTGLIIPRLALRNITSLTPDQK